jgi:adenine deaminase
VIENQAPTKALQRPLNVKSGLVEMDRQSDVCQIAVVERHRAIGTVVNAFVSGFGYSIDCAVASTVARQPPSSWWAPTTPTWPRRQIP